MWKITDIEMIDTDEDVLLTNMEMVLITIQDDYYQMKQITVTKHWLEFQELEIGDEWPEDLLEEPDVEKFLEQSKWTEIYAESLDLEDEE